MVLVASESMLDDEEVFVFVCGFRLGVTFVGQVKKMMDVGCKSDILM